MDQSIDLEVRITQAASLLQEIAREYAPAALASSLGAEEIGRAHV